MNIFMSKLLSSILQIILFAAIPFIVWFITSRKKESFFSWIGLKKINQENRGESIKYTLIVIVLFSIVSIFMLFSLKETETATSEFYGKGISVLPAALIYAIFNTSFSEELLFRGFLLKRLSNKFGFKFGNFIQSFLFGIIHGIMFFTVVGPIKAISIILFTGGIGYAMGYVNEKKSNGSIFPSWFIHGSANIFSSIVAMFSLI